MKKKKPFKDRTSLCLTDQEAQKEILLGGPTPSWVRSYTHLLYTAQDPYSTCRQSWFLNKFLCIAIYLWKLHEKKRNNFKVGQVSTSQIKKLRKRCCWVAQPLLGQYFHPSPVQVSRSLQRKKTVLLLKQILYVPSFTVENCIRSPTVLKVRQSQKVKKWSLSSKEKKTNIILNLQGVFPSQIKMVRKRFCWVDQPLSTPGHTSIPCTKHNIYKLQTVLAVRRNYIDQ